MRFHYASIALAASVCLSTGVAAHNNHHHHHHVARATYQAVNSTGPATTSMTSMSTSATAMPTTASNSSSSSSSSTSSDFSLPSVVPKSKGVFAHYMVGTITKEHAEQDVEDAIKLGLDAFALNVGDATQQYAKDALALLFTAAEERGFKLFISMDTAGAGGSCYFYCTSCNGPFDYDWIFLKYAGSIAYYKVNDKYPFVSTFNSGGFEFSKWHGWQANISKASDNPIYFVPDFDDTQGYYEAADGWWAYWGNALNGAFSWESTWPGRHEQGNGNLTLDDIVIGGTVAHNKSYMIGISTLQYKNAYNTNIYRRGGLVFPTRLQEILNMQIQPNFAEYITWNDKPEAHYMGTIWPEGNTDAYPDLYGSEANFTHVAWQDILSSWIPVFKAGGSPSDMRPVHGNVATGALWHKNILQTANCSIPAGTVLSPGRNYSTADGYCHDRVDGPDSQYYVKPSGFETGDDKLHWTVVLPEDAIGWTVALISGRKVIGIEVLVPGLNFGSAGTVRAGKQYMIVRDATGHPVATGKSTGEVSAACPNGIYNMNFQTGALKTLGRSGDQDYSHLTASLKVGVTISI